MVFVLRQEQENWKSGPQRKMWKLIASVVGQSIIQQAAKRERGQLPQRSPFRGLKIGWVKQNECLYYIPENQDG